MDWELVGRDDELAAALAAHADAAVPGVVIRGSTGSGKTRLAVEVGRRLEERGVRVARGTATSAAATVPLGALAGLIPPDRGLVDHEGALVKVVVEALAASGDRRTQALVVDDAALLDPASVAVVEGIAEQGAAFVVVVDRAEAPLPAWSWVGGALVLRTGRLRTVEVATLLRSVLGGPVAQETIRQVAAATGGNPFLLREMVGAARDEQRLRDEGGIWVLEGELAATPVVREIVLQRLRRLDAEARRAVELVAVAEALPVDLAKVLVADDVLDRLVASGHLVVAETLEGTVVRPAQRLHGEIVRDELGLLSHRQISAVLADAAEVTAASRPLDVLRVVGWRSQAGQPVPMALVLRASREARRLSQLDLAARLLADHAGDDAPIGALVLEAEVLHLQGRYQESAARSELAMARLSRGQGRDEATDGTILQGRVALAAAFNLVWGLGEISRARALLADVADRLAGEAGGGGGGGGGTTSEEAVRAELLAEACTYLPFAGESVAGEREARAVLALPDLTVRSRVRAGFGLSSSLLLVGREEQAVAAADAALAILGDVDTGWGQQVFYFNVGAARTMALERSGRLTEAAGFGARCYDAAADEGNRSGMALFAWLLGIVELSRGRWQPALGWLRECRVLERQLRLRGRQRWAFPSMAMGFALGGGIDEARAVLAELAALDEAEPSEDRFVAHTEVRAHAAVLALQGEVSAAVELLLDEAEGFAARGLTGAAADLLSDVLLAGAGRRAPVAAQRLLEVLDGAEGRYAEVRRLHAEAALVRSSTGLLDAAGAYGDLGYSYHQVATARAAAHRARSEGRTGTAGLARSLAEQGIGATGLQTPLVDATLQGLPPRQREVVRLALAGLANAEIAERLGLSLRTVENHLHRAYQALGVKGRAGLITSLGGG